MFRLQIRKARSLEPSGDKVYGIFWLGCTLLKSAPDFKIDIANTHKSILTGWILV
jgi:hypothetical protein